MFRPIKNLITYIQKNASGSAIFGGSAAVADEEEAAVQATEASEEAKEQLTTETRTKHNADVPQINMEEGNLKKYSETEATDVSLAASPADEENDFELQIKSIMLKKPLLYTDAVEVATTTTANGSSRSVVVQRTPKVVVESIVPAAVVTAPPPPHDINHSFDDELEDFRHDPTAHLAIDEICSVGSAAPTVTEDGGEDTEEEEPFLDSTTEIDTFADREIIVLNDAELNSSIASDALSEDPLAIDDLTQPPILGGGNPLDSSASTNDEEASASQDIAWLNTTGGGGSAAGGFSSVDGGDAKSPTLVHVVKTADIENMPIGGEDITRQPEPCLVMETEAPTSITEVISTKSKNDEQAEELRSDGSDSGLGSETSTLQITLNSVTSEMASSATPTPTATPIQERSKNAAVALPEAAAAASDTVILKQPLRSNLKRRLVDMEADEEVEEELSSCALSAGDIAGAADSAAIVASSQQKKPKRSINFDNVQVYYFPRQQGFGCVPSAGGCTLGMATHHVAFKTLTLAEHAAELRRAHRLQLQEVNPRGSSSDDSEESEEDYLSEGSGSDLDAESNGFLQPVSPKQRRALLKAAGVRKIDASEKAECRDIRNSREVCGCTCRDFCDPETCACSQAGIKCQVDRAMFPCGCSRDACGNSIGRVEFNPARVRTHFIHTIMRLEMESRQQPHRPLNTSVGGVGMIYGMAENASSAASVIGATALTATVQPTHYYGSGLQPQSNYSSGYASPAYTTNDHHQPSSSSCASGYYQPQSAAAAAVNYGVGVPSLSAAEMHATPPQYQLDSLESSLFSGSATPSYGELMPTYGGVGSTTATSPASFHNLNYTTIGGGLSTQVSAYSSYHHQATAAAASVSYLPPQSHNSVVGGVAPPLLASAYSSCAVPSVPPYGTATTTAATPLYHSIALETTIAPSSSAVAIIDGDVDVGDSSFISLNTPIVSSSLSQINDLLQHNRNTTAALVAVGQNTATTHLSGSNTAAALSLASIETPPIEDTHRCCLGFEELSPPLNPIPIMAVTETNSKALLPQTEPPLSGCVTVDACGTRAPALESVLTAAASTANN